MIRWDERGHELHLEDRDGTAGFYNYVYHTVAGFTEHDTFRSNQIREGTSPGRRLR